VGGTFFPKRGAAKNSTARSCIRLWCGLGGADQAVRQQIEAIRDIKRLEDLSERLVIVSSWAELMV
jgi:hypothetical protein